jgi:hypothetical protein
MDKITKLTSVKVNPELYEQFRIECVKYKYDFTRLVNSSMILFLNDENFKKLMLNSK